VTESSHPRPSFDAGTPSVARMYDYYLGGKDNFEVDRAAVERMPTTMTEITDAVHENRAFLRRAVRFIAAQGIGQFIDIGSGLPTVGNTHEVAQKARPGARVVYVDNDPVVLVHGRALLAADENTTVVTADMREPAGILGHPETRRLIDFDRPVGVLLIAMTHFLTLEERPAVMGALRAGLPDGSFVAISHATTEGRDPAVYNAVQEVYRSTPAPLYFRNAAEIGLFFEGFDLVEPGLVPVNQWRPDPADDAPATGWVWGGVGRLSPRGQEG
jgi:SAM-dependent methyltransferase